MKKLITLLLVLTGMISTASATDYIVSGNSALTKNNHEWWYEDNDNKLQETSSGSGIYYLTVKNCYLTGQTKEKFKIKTNENNFAHSWPTSDYWITVAATGNYDITYIFVESNGYVRAIVAPQLKWTKGENKDGGNWNDWHSPNEQFTNDGLTWYKDIPASKLSTPEEVVNYRIMLPSGSVSRESTSTSSGNDKFWQIFPTSDATSIAFGTSTTTYNYQDTYTTYSWSLTAPSYDFEKIRIWLTYDPTDDDWEIGADAYITKTVSGTNKYATLGCSVPLEIVEANDVTAYPLTANASTGKITKGDAITTIPGGEGALLENTTGENKTIRAKVLTSADASASNHLHAFTGSGKLTQPGNGNTYFILGLQDSHVGFYKVNGTSGNSMGANTAYLSVVGTLSRSAFFFDDETTGIEAIDSNSETVKEGAREYYNLNGQRVMNPTKGLYIVNGKKVIMK